MADLTATWATELGRYEGEDLKRALDAMRFSYKEFPPTLYQFADLCRDSAQMRVQTATKITHVRYGSPSAELLAAIHELSKDPSKRKRDPRDWARRLIQRDLDGENVHPYALQCAKEALGIGG